MSEALIFSGTTILVWLVSLAVIWGKMQQRIDANEKKIDDIGNLNVKIERISVAIFGIDGKNGLRGEFREVASKLDALIKRLGGE